MTFNGSSPVPLANELRYGGNTLVFSMTNRDIEASSMSPRIPRDTFLIRRVLAFHEDTFFETVEIKNFSRQTFRLQVEQWTGGRFDDVFEVRGYARPRRGRLLSPDEVSDSRTQATVFRYEGVDGSLMKTYVYRMFASEKIRLSPNLAGYFTQLEIGEKQSVHLKTVVSFSNANACHFFNIPFEEVSISQQMDLLSHHSPLMVTGKIEIVSDHSMFNRAVSNAVRDVSMLMTEEMPGVFYPYAGIPWFSAPFGRDGLITAYQMLPWYPKVARGVLDYVFSMLGKTIDPFTDEQPGKVFHEVRFGEMARAREVPFIPYYGSVDSTPLALILVAEYFRWTQDYVSLRKWWPHILMALGWIERWGDSDRDGFLEYEKQSATGLVNQGWKDSHDSVMHSDGRTAHAPIRLCEVQAYTYRAFLGISALASRMGDEPLSSRTRMQALQLKARFLDQFWDSDHGYIYLALDRDRAPCAVKSSNMGHCLWSNIVNPTQAQSIVRHLFSDSMFSGFGIRTLADDEAAYNPLSYHNGSVWPHDNSLIMEGLRNYGFRPELERLGAGLMDVLELSDDFRFPELFCGFRRRGNAPPVPYEVACKPQAWASGSVFLMLRSLLGLSFESSQQGTPSTLVLNSPVLTSKVNWLRIKGLQGDGWEVDLVFSRSRAGTQLEVERKDGPIRILKVRT